LEEHKLPERRCFWKRLLLGWLLTLVCVGGVLAAEAEVQISQLPPEARKTLALIRAGGPFPHSRDGSVFGNREALLPAQKRGYYLEYTVDTPGARDRGARRIIVGGDARRSAEFWYTSDHYASFARIVGVR